LSRSIQSQVIFILKQNKIPSRLNAHEYERKVQELNETIEILEAKLKIATDNKGKLLHKIRDNDDDVDRYKDQVARQASQIQSLNDEINRLNDKLGQLTYSNKNLNEKCKNKFEILNKELEEKDTQLDKFFSQIKAKDETIKYYSVNNEQVVRYQNIYKEEIDKLKSEKADLESKTKELQRSIDDLYVNRKSEAAMALEIDHLKEDNIRLLQLLKTTNEYKDFAYLSEDVHGGIRFVRSSENNKTRPKSSSIRMTERVKYEKVNPKNEFNWVPMDAYNFAFEFRDRNNLELSNTLLEELLFSVTIDY
jgi:chromosome segregation ATPase